MGRGSIVSYTYEESLSILKQDGYVLQFVHNQTPELCEIALKQDGYALQYVDISIFDTKKEELLKKIEELKKQVQEMD